MKKQEKQITVNFEQLAAIKAATDVQAAEAFIKNAKGSILDNAPWQAVLNAFIEWKREAEQMAGKTNQNKYMQDLAAVIDEANQILNK